MADSGVLCTYWFRNLYRDPGHADKGAMEVLDGLLGLLRGLEADIADSSLRKHLDIRDLAAGEVLAEVDFGYGRREVPHKDTRRLLGRVHDVFSLVSSQDINGRWQSVMKEWTELKQLYGNFSVSCLNFFLF
jgi:hypothetical protein